MLVAFLGFAVAMVMIVAVVRLLGHALKPVAEPLRSKIFGRTILIGICTVAILVVANAVRVVYTERAAAWDVGSRFHDAIGLGFSERSVATIAHASGLWPFGGPVLGRSVRLNKRFVVVKVPPAPYFVEYRTNGWIYWACGKAVAIRVAYSVGGRVTGIDAPEEHITECM